jgi:signal transduction histidine kinase
MVTHDLKSPLQAISGYLHILQEKSANHQLDLFDAKHIFNSMEYGLNDIIRMVTQINELLSYTNDHVVINKVNVEINWLIDEVVGLMRSLADEKKRTLRFIHSSEPIYLETDIDKVKRIIENFISNAIKYTRINGNITVQVDKEDSEILISVIDDGLGIPESNLKYIFEPYNNDQLHPGNHRSIGLGLYNCSFFSRLLGGRITVESRQGKGSVFCLHHPVNQNQINP